MDKLAEVLAGLRRERERLAGELVRVERAIGALEEVAREHGGAAARLPMQAPASASATPAPAQAAPLPYARMHLYAAVAAYLALAGQPKTSREIAEALRAGGYPTTSANFREVVRTMLKRRESAREFGIRVMPDGRRWFVNR